MQSKSDKTAISCIILAGGRGKRFNQEDKGLLILDDKPLIEHILGCIKPQVDDIVISANRNIEAYERYVPRVMPDLYDDFQGPLTGIATCLPECQHEWILVIPCDMPKLPGNLVEKLNETDSGKLIVAKAGDHRQLVFLMHRSLKHNLDDYLQHGHQQAMAWIALQQPEVVTFESKAGEFININKPEELASIPG